MNYNIEKINQIGKLVAEMVEEALAGEKKEEIRIVDVEMGLRESLREIGQSALRSYLEQADGDDLVSLWKNELSARLLCRLSMWHRLCPAG